MTAAENKNVSPHFLSVTFPPGYDHGDPPRVRAGQDVTYSCEAGKRFRGGQGDVSSQKMTCSETAFAFE